MGGITVGIYYGVHLPVEILSVLCGVSNDRENFMSECEEMIQDLIVNSQIECVVMNRDDGEFMIVGISLGTGYEMPESGHSGMEISKPTKEIKKTFKHFIKSHFVLAGIKPKLYATAYNS
jgi:hypothetical protein